MTEMTRQHQEPDKMNGLELGFKKHRSDRSDACVNPVPDLFSPELAKIRNINNIQESKNNKAFIIRGIHN